MDAKLSHIGIALLACVVVGCSSSQRTMNPDDDISARNGFSGESTRFVQPEADQADLVLAMSGWLDTPYRYGGSVKSGIDCSAYVQLMMQEAFDIGLPRTTQDQMRAGDGISKNSLQPGDLVFFETGRNQYHVGIYLSDGEFTHASTTAGVTVSHLDDYYWKDRYLEARRVLDRPQSSTGRTVASRDRTFEREKPKSRTESTKSVRGSSGTWTSPGKSSTGPPPKKTGW
ncbi:MAG: hypothetical protein HKN43_10030 [Rhodothermales bacterium]|nr:hypothetical protein [Rhodothermales bacterium]